MCDGFIFDLFIIFLHVDTSTPRKSNR